MPATSSRDRTLIGKIAAETSWANTADRTARTAPARRALDEKFLSQAGGDPARAAHLRKAHFARLALKSAQARRRVIEARKAIPVLEAQASAADAELAGGDAA